MVSNTNVDMQGLRLLMLTVNLPFFVSENFQNPKYFSINSMYVYMQIALYAGCYDYE